MTIWGNGTSEDKVTVDRVVGLDLTGLNLIYILLLYTNRHSHNRSCRGREQLTSSSHRIHKSSSNPHTRSSKHLSPTSTLMTLNNLINNRLSSIIPHGCEIISNVGYMISTCCMGFSGGHRVVGAVCLIRAIARL